jgi:fibronectin type 3 domain-containing protein
MNIRARCFIATCLILIMTVAVACGRKTSPQIPDSPRPEAVKDIKVTTRDRVVYLSWPIPARNVEGRDITPTDIQQFSVYRAEIKRERKKVKHKIYAEINMADLSPEMLRGNRIIWRDRNLQYGRSYSYRVRAISVRGGTSPQSDAVRIRPLMSLASPQGLAAQGKDSVVQLSWEPVTTQRDGSHYDGFIGYNIYRGTERNRFDELALNKAPLTKTSFEDIAVSNDSTYFYMVRSVDSPYLSGKESPDSEEASATPRDMTPPDSPKGLTVVPGVGRAFLTWNENSERDIAGYNVYRLAGGSKNYKKLTDKPLTRTTFSDEAVTQGAVFFYYITAVDKAGNEGSRSKAKKATIEKLQ